MKEIYHSKISAAGLDVDSIREHHKNVTKTIQEGGDRFFEVVDTCRFDNGGVRSCLHDRPFDPSKVVSFVPAAGASSRWLAPLNDLIVAISAHQADKVPEILDRLLAASILEFPIPPSLRSFLEHWQSKKSLPSDWMPESLLLDIESPKAFYPAVLDGMTFLDLKRMEDESIGRLAGEVFICPMQREGEFKQRFARSPIKTSFDAVAIEQGASLATVRFAADGSICTHDDGTLAPVPAGHGSLLRLFPMVRKQFPKAESCWIRNIDNVVGVSTEVVQASRDFLGTHEFVLDSVKQIRTALACDEMASAQRVATKLLEAWNIKVAFEGAPANSLAEVAKQLFHAEMTASPTKEELIAIFARVVVTMGQVPNTARDVGGTAVFARVNGRLQKLCLEVPHASAQDRKTFLEDPAKATHFNPVFVAVETPSDADIARWQNHPFWLVAKKSWRGRDVWYQESILYEMLGSSAFANVVFVEIPRILFNPHKALPDAKQRFLKHWT